MPEQRPTAEDLKDDLTYELARLPEPEEEEKEEDKEEFDNFPATNTSMSHGKKGTEEEDGKRRLEVLPSQRRNECCVNVDEEAALPSTSKA